MTNVSHLLFVRESASPRHMMVKFGMTKLDDFVSICYPNWFVFIELICLLKLCMVSIVQSQKYLECTFDRGDLPCKLIPVGTTPPLQTISYITVDDVSMKPSMPLSDVTSISK